MRSLRDRLLRLSQWALGFRYAKFGIVGASGTLVNMGVLWLGQELVFQGIASPRQRLYVSLALAIAVATVNNFCWNRVWTWADRRSQTAAGSTQPGSLHLLARYALASWLGIGLQYGLTLWFAHFMHYLLGNVLAILAASVSNFIANDRWTFQRKS
ncbi:MAG: hypothetical protein RLZZ401_698 [Pseudomonadota bacterium]|jgi:dolichol-phosphate mannosyltransferase